MGDALGSEHLLATLFFPPGEADSWGLMAVQVH